MTKRDDAIDIPEAWGFRHWLACARVTDDPVGDFIADARGDSTLPPTLRSMKALRSHVRARGGCDGAIAAVPKVWRRYLNWLSRQNWTGERR